MLDERTKVKVEEFSTPISSFNNSLVRGGADIDSEHNIASI